MSAPSATVTLACELIRRRSVTPDDAGCQELLAERLASQGFAIERLPFGEVHNLWARHGESGPLLLFLGHTDVVPAGAENAWQSPPFEPTIEEGMLYGRGAADMKGSIAAMIVACERFLARHPNHAGSVALLLTSDEEGPALNGTRRVIETLQARRETIDWCLVGEPSSDARLGDVVKNGRRGSLTGQLTIHGVQGHVAYPQFADNPVHRAAPALAELAARHWDDGNAFFPPTSFQIANLQAGTGADNVIPGNLEVTFNFRFSTEVSAGELQARVTEVLERHDLRYELDWRLSGEPFLTPVGTLVEAVQAATAAVTGQQPSLSTAGGTSDGRFIAPLGTQVVELGPINATIHKVNERVGVAELDALTAIYEGLLDRLLAV